jgi:hypothetical protein
MATSGTWRHQLGILLVGAVVLAGCSGPAGDGDAAPPTGTPTPAPTTPTVVPTTPAEPAEPEFEADEVDDLGKLCGTDDVRYHRAASYQGAAPHPLAVFAKEKGSKGYELRYIPRDDPPGYEPERPEDVALLACLTNVKSLPVGTCRYRTDNGSKGVRTDGQRFKIELFALATGKRIVNRTFDVDFCPPTLITYRGEIPKRMTSTLNDEHLFQMFDRYVSRTAP